MYDDDGANEYSFTTRTPLHAAEHVTVSEKTFSSKKCMAWFQEYAGPDHVLGPEGMEKFCEDIGVEPENVSVSPLSSRRPAADTFTPGNVFINGPLLISGQWLGFFARRLWGLWVSNPVPFVFWAEKLTHVLSSPPPHTRLSCWSWRGDYGL